MNAPCAGGRKFYEALCRRRRSRPTACQSPMRLSTQPQQAHMHMLHMYKGRGMPCKAQPNVGAPLGRAALQKWCPYQCHTARAPEAQHVALGLRRAGRHPHSEVVEVVGALILHTASTTQQPARLSVSQSVRGQRGTWPAPDIQQGCSCVASAASAGSGRAAVRLKEACAIASAAQEKIAPPPQSSRSGRSTTENPLRLKSKGEVEA